MNHSFNIGIAGKHSIEKAILFENILHWCKKNKSNNKNIVAGKAWTYNTYDAYSELFPYMKNNTIKKALREMVSDGLIEVRNDLNDNKWDKTNWYHASLNAEYMHRQQKSPLVVNKNILSIVNENDHHNSTDINTDINNTVTPIGNDVSQKSVVTNDKVIKKMTQMSHYGKRKVSSKDRILREIGSGRVFFRYLDIDLDAKVNVCLYGKYNALYDYYRNVYIAKEKAAKLWKLIDERIDAILAINMKERLS